MKNKNILIICISIVIVVLLIAIGIAFLSRNSGNVSNNLEVTINGLTNPDYSGKTVVPDEEFDKAIVDMKKNKNIIDKNFTQLFESNTATYPLNIITEEYLKAWKIELDNIISLFNDTTITKNILENAEDEADYVKDEILEAISNTTGSTYYSNIAQARVYRTAALKLIDNYEQKYDRTYQYIFNANVIKEINTKLENN